MRRLKKLMVHLIVRYGKKYVICCCHCTVLGEQGIAGCQLPSSNSIANGPYIYCADYFYVDKVGSRERYTRKDMQKKESGEKEEAITQILLLNPLLLIPTSFMQTQWKVKKKGSVEQRRKF